MVWLADTVSFLPMCLPTHHPINTDYCFLKTFRHFLKGVLIAGMSSACRDRWWRGYALISLRSVFSHDEWKLMDACPSVFAPLVGLHRGGFCTSPWVVPDVDSRWAWSSNQPTYIPHLGFLLFLLPHWQFLGSLPRKTCSVLFVGSVSREI